MEVEMVDGRSNLKIEVDAARIAIEWKNLFATELRLAARQLAKDSDLVTMEHYRQALPTATSRLLQIARTEATGSAHVQRRIA